MNNVSEQSNFYPSIDQKYLISLSPWCFYRTTIDKTSVAEKFLKEYPIVSKQPIEFIMFYLLEEKHYIDFVRKNRELHSEDQSAELHTSDYEASIRSESGSYPISYDNGTLEADVETDAEHQVLEAANKLLYENTKTYIKETHAFLEYLQKDKPTILDGTKQKIQEVREKIGGLKDNQEQWMITSKLKNLSLTNYNQVCVTLDVLAKDKTNGETHYNSHTILVTDRADETDLENYHGKYTTNWPDHVGTSAIRNFFDKPDTIEHYMNFAKMQRPILENNHLYSLHTDMMKNVPLAKDITRRLSEEVLKMENSQNLNKTFTTGIKR